jgi:predicted dehydrogenase
VGKFGGRWVRLLSQAKGVKVVAAADINAEALAVAQEKLSLPPSSCFKDFRKAIDTVEADALINVTPPKFHKPVALYAFRRGLDVLTEKPLADTMRNAKVMVEAARKARRKLMVSQNYRFQRWARTARRTVEKKKHGDLDHLSIKFFRALRSRTGFRQKMEHLLLVDMSIHHFDLIRYVLGADPVKIYARTWNPKWSWSKGDVAAAVIIEMKNGVTVVYDANWVGTERQNTWNGDWVFQFERGRLALRDDVLYEAKVGKEEKPVRLAAMPCQNQEYSLLEFRRALRENRQPEASGKDNLSSLAMVFAAIESSKRGRAVELAKFLS